MHILNRLRKLIRDTWDTSTTRDDKIFYLENGADFYNRNVRNLSTTILTPIDWINYNLPEDFYSIDSVIDLSTWKELTYNEDYEVDTITKELNIVVKDTGNIESYEKENLRVTYSVETTIFTETSTQDISIWENTITVSDISKYSVNQYIDIFNSTDEESVKITSVNTATNEITFSVITWFLTWATLFPDVQLLTSDKDIIVYYAANLITEVTSSSSTSWSKTSWKQWEITYTTENTSWSSVSSYMSRVNELLEENINSVLNLTKNSASFTKTLIF